VDVLQKFVRKKRVASRPASQEEDAARKAPPRPISSAEETPENSLEEVMPVPAATPQEVILKEMNIKPGELPEDIDEEELPPVSSQEMANALDTSILQAKGIHELNEMARELGIENFGTLKKHELIFQILQRNARRSGVIISDGSYWRFYPMVLAFYALKPLTTCLVRKIFMFLLLRSAL
jgi:hypothetical protein